VRMRAPLTFAIIPHLKHSRRSAEVGYSAGHEVILHQPMEPEDLESSDPGTGAIVTGMPRTRVVEVLRANLASVPHAVGLNNHMGSRATSDQRLMDDVLAAVASLGSASRELYFLDSRTSPQTVAYEAARRHGVPSAQRSVFLDNDLDPVRITRQLDELLATARETGSAVGIGHLKPETLGVLEAVLPRISSRDVRLVPLSQLVR